jgi:hypothetical protein
MEILFVMATNEERFFALISGETAAGQMRGGICVESE